MPRFTLPIFGALAVAFVIPLLMKSEKSVTAQAPAPKPADGSSYVVGLNVGSQLREGGFKADDIKSADFLMGIMDALKNTESRLTPEELQTAGEGLEKTLMARAQQSATENLTKSKAYLDANKAKDGVTTLPSGLQYTELKKGDGLQPKQTSMVKVHYEGKLINGEVFDSSIKRGEPASFRVNQVIAGWTEALQRMRVGDKWKLFIPPELAYGPTGSQGAIGPNEALIFEVELLGVQ